MKGGGKLVHMCLYTREGRVKWPQGWPRTLDP